jgi:hypothetical protein
MGVLVVVPYRTPKALPCIELSHGCSTLLSSDLILVGTLLFLLESEGKPRLSSSLLYFVVVRGGSTDGLISVSRSFYSTPLVVGERTDWIAILLTSGSRLAVACGGSDGVSISGSFCKTPLAVGKRIDWIAILLSSGSCLVVARGGSSSASISVPSPSFCPTPSAVGKRID